MAKLKIGLPMQMGIGLVLGVIVGVLAQDTTLGTTVFKPLGDIFIRLIRMVVVPLVFATLVAGAASVGDTAKLGRLATKTLFFYLFTTAMAVTIGLLLANLAQPGVGLNLSLEGLKAKEVTQPALTDTLINLIPLNPMQAMAQGNMLQLIIFAVVFGFALSTLGNNGQPVQRFFEICGDVMIKITGYVMLYAPIGIFGLIAYTVTRHGLAVLLPLLKVIVIMYVGCILLFVLVYTPILKFFVRIPLGNFIKGMAEPLIVAFTTCSSAAALPSNMASAEKLGASRVVSSFSMPLGNTINMDGTSLYMGICAIFVSQVYGMDLALSDQITIVLMAILAAVGTMGVPGAGLVMMSIVFVQVGIPLEGVALIAAVDRILDMARTPMNVLGDAIAALFVSRSEGVFKDRPAGALECAEVKDTKASQ